MNQQQPNGNQAKTTTPESGGPVIVQYQPWVDRDIIHGFTTRKSTGDQQDFDPILHSGSDPAQVIHSQKLLLEHVPGDQKWFVRPEQVHDSRVDIAHEERLSGGQTRWEKTLVKSDGVFSQEDGFLLTAYGADCPLVLFHSPDGIVGACHMSWQGMYRGIVENSISFVRKHLSGEGMGDLEALIGPSIRECCYEVGEDFQSMFLERYPDLGECFTENDHSPMFSLQKAIRIRLKEVGGLNDERIHDLEICNACYPEWFYSYRRSGTDTGRMIGYIML